MVLLRNIGKVQKVGKGTRQRQNFIIFKAEK